MFKKLLLSTVHIIDHLKALLNELLKVLYLKILEQLLLKILKFRTFVKSIKKNQFIFLKNTSSLMKYILKLVDILTNKSIVIKTRKNLYNRKESLFDVYYGQVV